MSGLSEEDKALVREVRRRYRDRSGVNCIPGWDSTPRIDALLHIIRKSWMRERMFQKILRMYADEGNWTGVDGNIEPDIPALWTPTDRDGEEPGPMRAREVLRKHGGGA